MSEHSVSNLPRWAQERIAALERKLIDAERRLKEASGGIDVSRVRWYTGMDKGVAMPDHALVEWTLGKEQRITAHLDAGGLSNYTRQPALRIAAQHELLIYPVAANVVYVREGRYDHP